MRLVKIAVIVALLYVHAFALPYLLPSDATFGIYESRREWLTVHVVCGTLALFLGPIQFWLLRNSPGVRFPPRAPLRSSAWISRISRRLRGRF